jgi:hypothetical protein
MKELRERRKAEAEEKGLVCIRVDEYVTPRLKQNIVEQLNNRPEGERVK